MTQEQIEDEARERIGTAPFEKAQRLVAIDGEITTAEEQVALTRNHVAGLKAEKAALQKDPDVVALRKALGGRKPQRAK